MNEFTVGAGTCYRMKGRETPWTGCQIIAEQRHAYLSTVKPTQALRVSIGSLHVIYSADLKKLAN